MESAIFGLIGVAFGAYLSAFKERWAELRREDKETEYLTVQISSELELFAARCAGVVKDDGKVDEDGLRKPQLPDPKFDPMQLEGVDWKVLPVDSMYEILDIPFKLEIANQHIASAFGISSAPEFKEGFEERQRQYADLGSTAWRLAVGLRRQAGFRERAGEEWASYTSMQKRRQQLRRAKGNES